MTTLAERLEQIAARGRARGFKVPPTAKRYRPERPTAEPKPKAQPVPPSPLAAALNRPLPAKWASDRSERTQLKIASKHAAAYLICKALGPEWSKRVYQTSWHWRCVTLSRRDGLELYLEAQNDSSGPRYRISCKDMEKAPSSIGVSARKTPLQIAADIRRRLLTAAEESHKQTQKNRAARAADIAYTRQSLLRIARSAGNNYILRHTNHRCRFEAQRLNLLHDGYLMMRAGYSDRFELELSTADVELAEAVAKLVKDWKDRTNAD